MKRIHIIGIVVIAVAIGAIITSLSDASTYADFSQAVENAGKEFHVVGKLDRSKEAIYNPQENPDMFVFHMIDNKGKEMKVVLHKAKPQDFEKSEQIVIIGKAGRGEFHADEILMKCPSKYNNGKPNA